MKTKLNKRFLLLFILVILLPLLWLKGGLDKIFLDSDLARDLSEISRLWIGQKIIWLGPKFSMGLHASPFYYYLFFIPVFISGGSAYSLIIFNVLLSVLSLFLLGFLSINKYGNKGIIIPLIIGLMPWWQEIAIHPGNGFTYALFLLAALSLLWFGKSAIISSLMLGISLSMHPGAVFALPIFIYEFIRRKVSYKNIFFSIIFFFTPFLPLIVFELATNGYWLGQWLTQPRYGVDLGFGIGNFVNLFKVSGINILLGLTLLVYMFYISQKKERAWIIVNLVGLPLLFLFNVFPKHYLFGIITIIWFTVSLILIQRRFGRVILVLLSMYFLINVLITPKPIASERPISKIEGTVDYFVENGNIANDKNLALVALKSLDTKTPQADDYRFFLRVRGFKVEEVSDYQKAEKLILFVEDREVDWENWNSWETDEFGKGELSDKLEINDIIIAVYDKKYSD